MQRSQADSRESVFKRVVREESYRSDTEIRRDCAVEVGDNLRGVAK